MEYQLGKRLDELRLRLERVEGLASILLKMYEESAPKTYKKVMEEIEKGSKE